MLIMRLRSWGAVMTESVFIRLTKACGILGVNYQKAWHKAVSGDIPTHRPGNGPYMVRMDDLPKLAEVFGVSRPEA